MAKKRGQGEGTISKRPDGSWWARVTIGVDSSGKQKRKAFYGKTRKEVADKLAAAQNNLNNGTYVEVSKMTFGQWLDTWFLEYVSNSVKVSTKTGYDDYINKHIKPVLGKTKLSELRGDMLQKFYNDKLENGRLDGKGGLSPKSIKNLHNMIHAALEQAYKNDLIIKNVSETVTLPKIAKKEMRVLSLTEQQQLLAVVKDNRLGIVISLALSTGMRLGELLALKWSDISFDKEALTVRRTIARRKNYDEGGGKTAIYVNEPKTDNSHRIIPLDASMIKELKSHKAEQARERLQIGEIYTNNDYVFASLSGSHIEPRTYQDIFKQIVKDAGIADVNFHALRHTFATRALEIGIPAKTVAEILGHANVSTTLNLYSHVSIDTKRDAINKIALVLKQ